MLMKRALLTLVLATPALSRAEPPQPAPTVEALPPVVVSTTPQAGDLKVDPRTTEIRATFSKTMANGNWAFVRATAADNFPTVTGNARYLEDGRTVVLPVKLSPNTTYVIWLNDGKQHNSFMDTNKNRALPYLLVFKTK